MLNASYSMLHTPYFMLNALCTTPHTLLATGSQEGQLLTPDTHAPCTLHAPCYTTRHTSHFSTHT
jgi:hypothetical protein